VPTAGGALRDLITQAAGMPPKALCFAARTDKGVHAIENIATFWFKGPLDIEAFLAKLQEIQVLGLRNIRGFQVDPKFHARGNSDGKHYRYVLNGPDPETSWQIVPELNLDAMREALSYIQGTHDFQSFRAAGCVAGTSVKTLYEVKLTELPEGLCLDLHGDAFLRKMIRILVGVLCEIGTGLRKPEDMKLILDAKNRQVAGITAPACGLTLLGVDLKG
jgi:tRNA pseudouridine38-40 synthase